jgi:hypothetical protein
VFHPRITLSAKGADKGWAPRTFQPATHPVTKKTVTRMGHPYDVLLDASFRDGYGQSSPFGPKPTQRRKRCQPSRNPADTPYFRIANAI